MDSLKNNKTSLKTNKSPSISIYQENPSGFVGHKELLEQNECIVKKFEKWQKRGCFEKFHHSHYDWYAFPIPELSSFGSKYTVSLSEIRILKENSLFLSRLRSSLLLLCESWGWDLLNSLSLSGNLTKQQCWQRHPVRLYKMGLSALIFFGNGDDSLFSKLGQFADFLENKKESLEFHSSHEKKIENVKKRWKYWNEYLQKNPF